MHRLLQVAANVYAATSADLFPPVFRPKFAPDPNLTGGVIISGYYLDNDPATVDAWLETNPYRIPAVLGVRKGMPNFNELTTQNGVTAARRLQFVRSRTNAPPFQTNQMYLIGVSNSVGVEFWNSYTQTFAQELQLDCRFMGSYELTSGGITLAKGDESITVRSNVPPNSWKGYLGFESQLSRLSFKVPLLTNTIFISDSVQRFSPTPRLEPLTETFESGGFPIPGWELAVSNSFVCVLSSGSRIVDLVLLPNLTNRINVSSVIFNASPEFGMPWALNWWSTNRSGGDGTPTTGVLNQIATSLDNPPLDTFYWREYGLGNQFMTGQDRDRAIESFRQFMFPWAYTNLAKTNLIQEAPFSPTRKLVFVRNWQANDPLIHHLPGHLTSSSSNSSILLVRPLTGELTTNLNLGLLNARYRPWLGAGRRFGLDDINPAIKDHGVTRSDDWRVPSGDAINVRRLDEIHRGTPWQTLYFDGIAADTATWNRAFYDPDGLAHPTNDWALIQLIRQDLVADSSAPSSVINNTIVGNAASRGAALFVASGAAATSINNIFAFNESGVYAEPNASMELANNCVHGNSIAYKGVSPGPSDLNVDPRFKDVLRSDFSLLADSALIDAGNDGVISTSERSGPTQVYGSHIDIGAHEFGPAGTPVITGRAVISDSGFEIMARGFAGQRYVIEASPDLISWTALGTNVAQLGQLVFRDAQSTNLPQRFYRVKLHSP